MKVKRWALVVLNRIALTIFLYASFLYFLKRIVFVKRHVWFFRIYIETTSVPSLLFSSAFPQALPLRTDEKREMPCILSMFT